MTKIQFGRMRLIAAAISFCAGLCSAEDVTWAVPCASPVRWLENVDNWNPARFPGADDTVVLGTSAASPADVYLSSGDVIAVFNATVASTADTSAKVTVQSGASLTFASTAFTNRFSDASRTFSELDIDGGTASFSSLAWFSDTGTGSVIRVRNGGALNFANKVTFGNNRTDFKGATKMYIGTGSTVRQDASSNFILGDGKTTGAGTGSGGEIEINGGTFIAGKRLYFHCGPYDSHYGHGSIRLKSGEFSFADADGALIFFGGGCLANELIQSGGNFSGGFSFQMTVPSKGDNLIAISGGTNTAPSWAFGTLSGNTSGRMHMRIMGREGIVKVGSVSFYSSYGDSFTTPPIFMEFVVDPSTRRDSTYPATPVYVTKARYSGGYGAIRGVHHIRPAGGVQIVHQDYFPMYVKAHDGWIDGHGYDQIESDDSGHGFCRYLYGSNGQYQMIGDEMWTNVFAVVYKNEVLGTDGATWQFRQKLKAEAELVSGAAALATPVVRGWLALPALTKRELRNLKLAKVRFAVTPGEGESLQSVVEGFRTNGYPDSAVEASGIYNVCLVVPKSRLAVGVATDKMLIDFAEYPNYASAKNGTPMIRARVSAVKWDPTFVQRGMDISFR